MADADRKLRQIVGKVARLDEAPKERPPHSLRPPGIASITVIE
jgi:hypothetical protein